MALIQKREAVTVFQTSWGLTHFGAISGWLAVNATCTLIYNIEKAWEKKEILTALAFDIKEAFDTIMEKRLTKCL